MPPLTRNVRTFLIASGALLLVMMLFYPFGYDQAAFSVGGDMVLKNGAVPFRDFLDTKPPFIFYIYSVALFIFGHHDWSARAFDVIFHFAALFYFYKVLVSLFKNEDTALVTCFIYTLLYTTSGYWMTAQAETFAVIPSVVIFYHTERFLAGKGKPIGNALAIGLASTVLFFLKSTLMTVPLASMVFLFTRQRNRKSYSFALSGVGFAVLSSAAYLYYLSSVGALDRFFEVIAWVRQYGDIVPLLSWDTITEVYLQHFPWHLVRVYSPTFLVAAGLCIFMIFSNRKKDAFGSSRNIYLHLALQAALGLLAVMYERKCFPYHYSRTFWAMTPLIVFGLTEGVMFIRTTIRPSVRKYVYLAIIIFTLPPLYRIGSQPLRWTFMELTGMSRAQIAGNTDDHYPLDKMQELAQKYSPTLTPEDNIFFWGNHVGVYFYLDKLPTTIALTNTPLITSWSPPAWRDSMMAELRRSSPKLFITERGDFKGFINFTELDSWENLQAWDSLRMFLEEKYVLTDSVGGLRIFTEKEHR